MNIMTLKPGRSVGGGGKRKKEEESTLDATRRFIITEGIFKKDGAMVDLPKLVRKSYSSDHDIDILLQMDIKNKHKFRDSR